MRNQELLSRRSGFHFVILCLAYLTASLDSSAADLQKEIKEAKAADEAHRKRVGSKALSRSQKLRAKRLKSGLRNGSIHQEIASASLSAQSVSGRRGSYLENLSNPDRPVMVITQIEDAVDNSVVLTINDAGQFALFLYANDYLGYVSPADGSLLYCDDFEVENRAGLQIPLLDCSARGHITGIAANSYYPGTSVMVRRSDFPSDAYYYRDGSPLRDRHGNWFYQTGPELYNASSRWFKWVGTSAHPMVDTVTGEARYPEGGTLFSAGWLRYRNYTVYSYKVFDAYYRGSFRQIVGEKSGGTYWGFPSGLNGFDFARVGSDEKIHIQYPNGWTLKKDDFPYLGKLYDRSNHEVPFVSEVFPFPDQSGDILVDADRTTDFLGVFQYEDTEDTYVVHAAMQNRTLPERPPVPGPIRRDYVTARTLGYSWTSGGGSTSGFVSASFVGTQSEPSCAGAADMGDATQADLADLEPDTNYTLVVCARNIIGEYSDPQVYYTRTAALPPAPLNAEKEIADYKYIKIGWTSGGGNTAKYAVDYAVAPASPTDCASLRYETSNRYFEADELVPGVTYHFMVCSISDSGERSETGARVAVSALSNPPPQVIELRVAEQTDTSITVEWETGGGTSSRFVVSETSVGVRNPGAEPSGVCAQGHNVQAAAGTSTYRYTLRNLNPSTLYRIRVCSFNPGDEVSPHLPPSQVNPMVESYTNPSTQAEIRVVIELQADGSRRLSWNSPLARRVYAVDFKDAVTGEWYEITDPDPAATGPEARVRGPSTPDGTAQFVDTVAMRIYPIGFYRVRVAGGY